MTAPRERILCAAVKVDDGLARTFHPTNVPIGLVICGHRHHVCIQLVEELFQAGSIPERQRAGEHQGFLTSLNRFVDRAEAARIAWAAGQTERELRWLSSEDLY